MKQSFLKKSITEITNTVDSETGEILETNLKNHSYIANSKEDFMLVYTKLLSIFQDSEMTLPEIKVFSYLLQVWNFNQEYEIGRSTYELLGNKFKLKPESVRNAVYKLKDRNLIFSKKYKLFMLNPRYAFKGSSMLRNESLKTIIELGCKDC
jgi:hypothetical protein